jgi:hypothetical protein
MAYERARVLLLGERAMGASMIRRRLQQLGCSCWFSVSVEEGMALWDSHAFHLIICIGGIRQALSMIAHMGRTNCNIYCSYPLENSCLWVPLMANGRECLGTPALRPSEFLEVLGNVVIEIESGQVVTSGATSVAAPRYATPTLRVKSKAVSA